MRLGANKGVRFEAGVSCCPARRLCLDPAACCMACCMVCTTLQGPPRSPHPGLKWSCSRCACAWRRSTRCSWTVQTQVATPPYRFGVGEWASMQAVLAFGWLARRPAPRSCMGLHCPLAPLPPQPPARRDDQARLAAVAADHEQRVAALRAEWDAERVSWRGSACLEDQRPQMHCR